MGLVKRKRKRAGKGKDHQDRDDAEAIVYDEVMGKSFAVRSHNLRIRTKIIRPPDSKMDSAAAPFMTSALEGLSLDDDDLPRPNGDNQHELEIEDDLDQLHNILKESERDRTGEGKTRATGDADAMNYVCPRLAYVYATGMERCRCGPNRVIEGYTAVYCIGFMESGDKYFPRCKSGCGILESLVARGYFPTRPNKPQTAISLDMLDLFQKQSSAGAFSKQGFARAWEDFHRDRFWIPFDKQRSYEEQFRICIPFWIRTRRMRDELINRKLNKLVASNDGALFEEVDMGMIREGIPKGMPLNLKEGGLQSLCPACFYRISETDKSITIICIDGNFQHYRLMSAGKEDLSTYQNLLFFEIPDDDARNVDTSTIGVSANCSRNFTAANKPFTMRFQDETGLVSVVCRHDIPLRFVNMYAGERLGWIVFTAESFRCLLKNEIDEGDLIVLYDVACQLGPHLQNHRPELMEFIKVAVNKFHGYAHEYKCHETWGVHQTSGAGDSDGEGTERVWALLRTIIVAGRDSTNANRQLFIENLALAIAEKKRAKLGGEILRRYMDCLQRLRATNERLDMIIGKPLVDRSDGTVISVVSESFLRDQQKQQQAYFASSSPLVSYKYMEIFEALRSEMAIKSQIETLNIEHTRMGPSFIVGDDLYNMKFRQKIGGLDTLKVRQEKTDALLKRFNQTRDEWKEGGERYRLAERWKNPDRDTYEIVLAEKQALKKHKASLSTLARPAGTNTGEDTREDRHTDSNSVEELGRLGEQRRLLGEYELARDVTDRVLREREQTRDDWFSEDSVLWATYHNLDCLFKLEKIYQDILHAASSRAMQYRQLHSQSSGNKISKKIIETMLRHYPAMQTLIRKFNETALELPESLRPPVLSLEAFRGTDTGPEKARDALFYLHQIRSRVANLDKIPTGAWARSAPIRLAIADQLKKDRSLEELALLEKEWNRTVLYKRNMLVLLIAVLEPGTPCLGKPNFAMRNYRRRLSQMLWAELYGVYLLIQAAKASHHNERARRSAASVPGSVEPVCGVDVLGLSYFDLEEIFVRSNHLLRNYEIVDNGMSLRLKKHSGISPSSSQAMPTITSRDDCVTVSATPTSSSAGIQDSDVLEDSEVDELDTNDPPTRECYDDSENNEELLDPELRSAEREPDVPEEWLGYAFLVFDAEEYRGLDTFR